MQLNGPVAPCRRFVDGGDALLGIGALITMTQSIITTAQYGNICRGFPLTGASMAMGSGAVSMAEGGGNWRCGTGRPSLLYGHCKKPTHRPVMPSIINSALGFVCLEFSDSPQLVSLMRYKSRYKYFITAWAKCYAVNRSTCGHDQHGYRCDCLTGAVVCCALVSLLTASIVFKWVVSANWVGISSAVPSV